MKTKLGELSKKWEVFGLNADEISHEISAIKQHLIHSKILEVI